MDRVCSAAGHVAAASERREQEHARLAAGCSFVDAVTASGVIDGALWLRSAARRLDHEALLLRVALSVIVLGMPFAAGYFVGRARRSRAAS